MIGSSSAVDCGEFAGADPAHAPATFLAVGRFTPKKAPHLTLEAFARVQRLIPTAVLRMIGDGPLTTECLRLGCFSMERSIGALWKIIQSCVRSDGGELNGRS
jgi:hypothetical protein